MNIIELNSLIKIIQDNIYQEQKWSENLLLRDAVFYRGFIRYITINGNKLFSVKEVGFKPLICFITDAKCSSFASKISCSTVSNAFCKSKIPQPIFPSYNFFPNIFSNTD